MPKKKQSEHAWVPDELRELWEALSLSQQNFCFHRVMEERSAAEAWRLSHPDITEESAWTGGYRAMRNVQVLEFIERMQRRKFEAMCLSMEEIGAFLGRVVRARVPGDLVHEENADLIAEYRETAHGTVIKTPDKLAAAKLAVELLKNQVGEQEAKEEAAISAVASRIAEKLAS